jgi:hypothetical protein
MPSTTDIGKTRLRISKLLDTRNDLPFCCQVETDVSRGNRKSRPTYSTEVEVKPVGVWQENPVCAQKKEESFVLEKVRQPGSALTRLLPAPFKLSSSEARLGRYRRSMKETIPYSPARFGRKLTPSGTIFGRAGFPTRSR